MFQSLLCVWFCCSSMLFNDVEGANLGIRTWLGVGVGVGLWLLGILSLVTPVLLVTPLSYRICFFAV